MYTPPSAAKSSHNCNTRPEGAHLHLVPRLPRPWAESFADDGEGAVATHASRRVRGVGAPPSADTWDDAGP